jgi:1-deoxy-D-xylulose-5-phosphate reductoisomerase
VRAEDALRHPTWSMGAKITIDSATLANKALEVIEAHFLFGLGYDRITAVVHPQSIIHSMVEFVDGSVLAQMGFPTMEIPILYALSHPERLGYPRRRFDPVAAGELTFEPLREDAFPCIRLGVERGAPVERCPPSSTPPTRWWSPPSSPAASAFPEIAAGIEHALGEWTGGPVDELDSCAKRTAGLAAPWKPSSRHHALC